MKKYRSLIPMAFALALLVSACEKAPVEPTVPVRSASEAAPATAQAAPAEPSVANPCNTGPDPNPNAPILCIDDSDLAAITIDPPPSTDIHLKATRTAHWFTKSGTGTVGILYDTDLLDPPDIRPGAGHTKAKAKNQTGSVKYSVVVQKGTVTSNVIDPTIIIDPYP